MSGPSSGAREQADKLVNNFTADPAFVALRDRIADQLQANFDLGHKSAGGAQCDKVPAMGGLLEIALDQEEIDFLCKVLEPYEARGERDCATIQRFLEKIQFHRSSRDDTRQR